MRTLLSAWTHWLFFCFLSLLPMGQAFAFEASAFVPNIVDDARILTPQEKHKLNLHIERLQTEAGMKIAIYTLMSLHHETIEEAARVTFKKWKLGDSGKNNGLLILVAIADRKARIEVGYGLEGNITDVHSKRILDLVMLPHFKTKNYALGFEYALTSLRNAQLKDKDYLGVDVGVDQTERHAVETDVFGNADDPNWKRGQRAWLWWMLIVWILPIFSRTFAWMGMTERERRKVSSPFWYQLQLDNKTSWFLKIFFSINPGIFILIFGSMITDEALKMLWSETLKFLDTRAMHLLLLVLAFWPPVLRFPFYVLGVLNLQRGDRNPNPVLHKGPLGTVLFLIDLNFGSIAFRLFLTVFIGGFMALSMFTKEPVFAYMVVAFGCMFLPFHLWHTTTMVLLPLLSRKHYFRAKARTRLHRIKTRVYGTRQIFGQSYTYSPSSSSSSSGGSSYSSSSGGGSSGGGGASSSW